METVSKPKTTSKLDLLLAVENIVDLAKDSQLSPEFYKKAARYIKYLGSRLDLTREQCVLLSLFVDRSDDDSIELSDLAKFLDCRNTRMIRHMSDVDVLVCRELLRCSRTSKYIRYRVPLEVVDAFKNNIPFTPRKLENLTCRDLFDELEDIFSAVDDDELDVTQAYNRIKKLIDDNGHILFVQKVLQYDLDTRSQMLLLLFCHLFVANNDDRIGFHDIRFMFEKYEMRHIRNYLIDGEHELQKLKLVEWSSSGDFADREYFRLTMNAKRELLDELKLPSLTENRVSRGVLKASDIRERSLYYPEAITHSIDELGQLLEPEHYNDIRQRLQEQGLRSGFTCLFYGGPGTGKTETALQLARRTGRDILQVNFAELKSMWVGESEKNVKALFDAYRQRVNNSEITPILLFNEADAIIGKRQEGAERAVDKMENSLQNIILQEMETLDGILIATTNLAQNMDKAFERRFLYKIRFDKPTVEARTAIWREMLPALNDADARLLAERYDFSGGQIENIARHYAIDAILHGDAAPTVDNLAQHCDQERIDNKKSSRIGFAI